MSDKEYKSTLIICTFMMISFIFFPAFCFITILFGYVWTGFIIMECIVAALIIPCFVLRTIFLIKYPNYLSKKRLVFETVSYVACLLFAFGTAFLVKDNAGVFTYYPFNIYIQPLYMIFVLVVMGFHVGTSKKVAKAYNSEKRKRNVKQINEVW